MRSSLRLAALALSLLAPACARDQPPSPAPAAVASAPGLPDRNPALAHRLVAAGGVLVDVRTPEEYAARHLDGAVNIPVDELSARLGEVDKLTGGDKGKPIVVYCQSGGRAGRAKSVLVGAGHPQVENLGGDR